MTGWGRPLTATRVLAIFCPPSCAGLVSGEQPRVGHGAYFSEMKMIGYSKSWDECLQPKEPIVGSENDWGLDSIPRSLAREFLVLPETVFSVSVLPISSSLYLGHDDVILVG